MRIFEKFKIGFPIGFINIGGITNLTKIISIASNFEDNITAHDIGPGNCLIDDWVRKNSNKKFVPDWERHSNWFKNEFLVFLYSVWGYYHSLQDKKIKQLQKK